MHLGLDIISIALLVLIQAGFGASILVKAVRSKITLSFAGICFTLALWAGAIYMLKSATSVGEVEFWGRCTFLGPILTAYFFLYFSLVFPRGEVGRLLNIVLFLPTLVFILMIPTDLIQKKGVLAASGPVPVWGSAYPLFGIYLLGYFILCIYNLLVKYRQSRGNEKRQIRYIFFGLFLSLVFGVAFNLVFPAMGVAKFLSLGPYFTLIFIGFTAYAITKHHLMNISVIISRAAAESLATFSLGVGYVLFVWLYRTVSTQLDFPFIVLSIIYGIFVEQVYPNLRLFFQTTSDKLFLRGKYDYYKALSDASSRVGMKLALPDILKVLYDTFSNVVEIADPRIFLPEHFTEADKISDSYVVYDKETYQPRASGQRVGLNDRLITELITRREPLSNIKEAEAALVVPCLLEDRLIAFFALGAKLSEDPYTDEDLGMLKTLANQVAIILDHTHSYEKIKADLEVAEIQLERSERLASLGTLTAGVTHEIRNPLTVIRTETERLANQERDLAYLKQFRSLVIKHIDRISGIVSRMLQLAKEKEKQEVDIDLRELIETTLQFFTFSRIAVKEDFEPVPPIKGDPEAMQEVFVNLIQNALDAMGETGELTLRTYKDDGRVVAEISDTGKGVPEEIREKIFDPFYLTRHEGVGLGLSIVHRIVREHGGSIKVESQLGKGTTFKLLF